MNERSAREGQGTLFLVSTPIGNLEDITLRARRVLAEADLVAAEDTRRTRKLLSHLGLSKPLHSHYEHNEKESAGKLVRELLSGNDVALVTDGGTPGLSDPGYRLVNEAIQAGIQVVPIPGPSAALAALVASGLPTDRFTFIGFLTVKKGQRRKKLEELKQRPETLVFFESPKRVKSTLADLQEILGSRKAALAREITKLHEEWIRGSLENILQEIEDRELLGEITLVVQGALEPKIVSIEEMEDEILHRLEAGASVKTVVKDLVDERGWPRKELYNMALQINRDK